MHFVRRAIDLLKQALHIYFSVAPVAAITSFILVVSFRAERSVVEEYAEQPNGNADYANPLDFARDDEASRRDLRLIHLT